MQTGTFSLYHAPARSARAVHGRLVLHQNIGRQASRLTALLALSVWLIPTGRSSEVEEPLPPGDRPPPTALSRIEDAGVAADHGDADHIIVHDHTRTRVKSSGVAYVDGYILYKVLTSAGCRNQSVLSWNYDPQSSAVEVREVNLIRNGERIPVDVSQVHDLPAPQSWIYWQDRIKTLQLPRLQINDGIEVTTFRKGFSYALLREDTTPIARQEPKPAVTFHETEEDARYIPPMPGEYFDIVLFAASVPIVEKRYDLTVPADKRLHSEVYNGPLYARTSYSADSTTYAWWGFDLPACPSEPQQPDESDFVTKVVLATVESWGAKSRWFFDVNRNQFEVTLDIQAKVREIFEEAGLTDASEEEKAEALVHWVAQNIRYSGQTMGEGEGFMLHPGPMIFEQRSGVCKDIAGMLVTMMRAAGMDSYAAMSMAGSRIEDLPADQFNHCVCALRKPDRSFEMYDPTWVPYDNSIWSLLEAEQHYLIGTPEGETLARIAYSPPEASALKITHTATLDDDGTLSGTLEFSGSGALDGRLRNFIVYSRRADLTSTFARLLSNISDRVQDIRVEHPAADDFNQNMWITLHYRIPHFVFPISDGFEFTSPMMQVTLNSGWLFSAGRTTWSEERKTDVFLYFTQRIDGTETIRLPKGYALADPPASKEVDETYGYFKGTSEMSDRDLVTTQRVEVRRRQIPPEGYAGFKSAIDEAKAWGDQVFRVQRGEG